MWQKFCQSLGNSKLLSHINFVRLIHDGIHRGHCLFMFSAVIYILPSDGALIIQWWAM